MRPDRDLDRNVEGSPFYRLVDMKGALLKTTAHPADVPHGEIRANFFHAVLQHLSRTIYCLVPVGVKADSYPLRELLTR